MYNAMPAHMRGMYTLISRVMSTPFALYICFLSGSEYLDAKHLPFTIASSSHVLELSGVGQGVEVHVVADGCEKTRYHDYKDIGT